MSPFPRLAFVVLLAFAALALVMAGISTRLKPAPKRNLHGLGDTQLGIAVELVRDQADFDQMVGLPAAGPGSTSTPTRTWLRRQQFLDFLFIALYVALFWLLGGVEKSAGFPVARLLGTAAQAAIVCAGLCDVLEDVAILRALAGSPETLPIRTFGLPKWGLFFLAALLLSAWFFRFSFHPLAAGAASAPSGLDRALAGLIGLLLAAGSLLGLAGVLRGSGAPIPQAMSYGIVPAIVVLFILMVRLQ
jgi:hypothetical protein